MMHDLVSVGCHSSNPDLFLKGGGSEKFLKGGDGVGAGLLKRKDWHFSYLVF